MFDPLPLHNPPWLMNLITPVSDYLNMPTLTPHIHEVLFAFTFYQVTLTYISPVVSSVLFRSSYNKLSTRTKFNWDVHVVSFVQSVFICGLAFYIMIADTERASMSWQERVWGYDGALGLNQAFGCGYFLWDLYICTRYMSMFGPGMLAHAVSALAVYSFGFRPFLNYYAPNFVLYELSSPFLNIHWFCDKLDMTGGLVQLINGVLLLVTFAGCRLVWGTYASYQAYSDVSKALTLARNAPNTPPLALSPFALNATTLFNSPTAALQVIQFAPQTPHLPSWLWMSFAVSNTVLNLLNWFWFAKMISTIRKRFDPPFGTRDASEKETVSTDVARGVDHGRKTLEVDSVELRRRVPIKVADDVPPPA